MASRATGILKDIEDRMPAPWARRFGTPAAAAWTGVFVLVAAFLIINWGVGLMLDAVLHPAGEEAVATEPGEPASVIVDLPPPLTPRVAPVSVPAAPAAVAAVYTPQRSARSDSRSTNYRHGWRSRRWRNRTEQPAEAVAATATPTAAVANHSPSPTGLLVGGLPKRVTGSSDAAARKEAAATPSAPKPAAAPPAPVAAAPKAGPPAAP